MPLVCWGLVGTIPACAGSRGARRRRTPGGGDHPRVCGEQCECGVRGVAERGPSPRVRGADASGVTSPNGTGTIPACAGSRGGPRAGWRRSRDHPRVCGEQADEDAEGTRGLGPSPRVRGAVSHGWSMVACSGTIPACAGSSVSQVCDLRVCRDHPRVCGEQPGPAAERWSGVGPSPRVRGADWLSWAFPGAGCGN